MRLTKKKSINSCLTMRIDEDTKEEAKRICERHGMSLSDAIRFFVMKIVREDKLSLDDTKVTFK